MSPSTRTLDRQYARGVYNFPWISLQKTDLSSRMRSREEIPANPKKASWKKRNPILFWTPATVRSMLPNMAMLSRPTMMARTTWSLKSMGLRQICLKLRKSITFISVVKGLYISTVQRLSRLLFLESVVLKDSVDLSVSAPADTFAINMDSPRLDSVNVDAGPSESDITSASSSLCTLMISLRQLR